MNWPQELQTKQLRDTWSAFFDSLKREVFEDFVDVSLVYILMSCRRIGQRVVVESCDATCCLCLEDALSHIDRPTSDGRLNVVMVHESGIQVVMLGDSKSPVLCGAMPLPGRGLVVQELSKLNRAVWEELFALVGPVLEKSISAGAEKAAALGLADGQANRIVECIRDCVGAAEQVLQGVSDIRSRLLEHSIGRINDIAGQLDEEQKRTRSNNEALAELKASHEREMDRLRRGAQAAEATLRGQLARVTSELDRLQASGLTASALKGSMQEALREAYG